MASRLPTPERCLNCGRPVEEKYCTLCGQKNVDYRTSLATLLREVVHETFEIDSRLGRTIAPFLFKPGTLTREYNAGRRARFTPPLRLYIFTSLLCFLVVGIRSQFDPLDVAVRMDEVDEAVANVRNNPDLVKASIEKGLREQGASEREIAQALKELDEELLAKIKKDRDPTEDVNVGVDVGELPEPWRSTPVGRTVQQRIDQFEGLSSSDKIDVLRSGVLAHAPTAAFLLLPIYALLLKLAFLGTGRYYVEHLIFSLHLHAYTFLVLAIVAAIPIDGVGLLAWTIPVYFVVALKRAYEIGWLATILRVGFVSLGYSILLALGVALLIVAAIVVQ